MKEKLTLGMLPILVLILVTLIPVAHAPTVTMTIDPLWEKTTNAAIDIALGVASKPITDPYWTWTSTVWDGPPETYDGRPLTIPSDSWALWYHRGWFTHLWFKTTIDTNAIPGFINSITVRDKYYTDRILINDNLYIYVNGAQYAYGGTSYVAFVDWDLPGTVWYIDPLSLPPSAFISGVNEIWVLAEEWFAKGGLGHLVFEISYLPHPLSMGYWKNHPEAWSLETITIGGTTYNKETAISIIKQANSKDATYMLAAQLITAKLNLGGGPGGPDIAPIIEQADALLTAYPVGSDPSGSARDDAIHLMELLDAFNNAL